jgi:hypothetical protein
MHIQCFNHMANLVVTHTIKTEVFSDLFTTLPGIIRNLHSAQSVHVTGLRRPR